MAATPPMPPGANNIQLNGNILEQQQENSTSNTTANIVEALQQNFQFKALLNADEDQETSTSSSNCCNNSSGNSNSNNNEPTKSTTKLNAQCSCTNISIMHLFHEMKQEFPTLPDALVTQCVNENCHQRDNCIQMLRKELSLHPSPVQSYPAKVVQQQQHLQQRPLKPTRAAPTTPTTTTTPAIATATPPSPSPARPRPTTLNLQRQLNAQLQQKIQQRQQQQQRQPLTTPSGQYKPLRRAPPLPPLPPLPPPKPTTTTTTTNSFSNDSSCLTSPLSSSESELSLNVSLSSPTSAAQSTAQLAATAQQQQLRSPVRHRSVINLQPEPPYARDFLTNAIAISPAISPTSSSSGQSTPGGNQRKSFTSLNLTLRQPQSVTCNGATVQPSTIDITAGPAPSGNGSSGITYSSSSFDARRGTHKNFQLTVTDEGSVFSAGCVRPQTPLYAPCAALAIDGATPPAAATPTTAAAAQQQQLWEQATAAAAAAAASEMPGTETFPYATLAQKYVVASNYNNNHLHNNNNSSSDNSPSVTHMPLYEGIVPDSDCEAYATKIERQKTRRDKLANALRDNKKRLLCLEQEINILTEPVPEGESERLDRDIKKLTDDCQRLLNMINDPQLNGTATAANSNSTNRQLTAPAGAQLQPFQRQQRARQPPPNSLRLNSVPSTANQPHLDFVQHQSSVSAPSSGCLTPQQQQQQQMQLEMQPPPTYAQYYQFQQFLQNQRAAAAAAVAAASSPSAAAGAGAGLLTQHTEEDDESMSESDVDEGEEPLDMWACNLCTFRNHPQLNICEACDNVRIPLGMIRIVPSGLTADNAAATPMLAPTVAAATTTTTAAVETDANRQQPYALHT